MNNEQKRNWCVYMHTVPKELSGYDWNKHYIGITGMTVQKRWGKNGHGYKNSSYFYRAIQKYGWDNIEHEILEDGLTLEEASNKEKYYIKKYKTDFNKYGYNIRTGGYFDGGGRNKNVAMYNLDGKLEKTFPSMTAAAEYLGITALNHSLGFALKHPEAQRHGYLWREIVDYNNVPSQIDPYIPQPSSLNKPVLQFSLQGDFVKRWDSLKSIQDYYNSSIDAKSFRPGRMALNSQWRYEEEYPDISSVPPYHDPKAKPVYVYQLDGSFFTSFDSFTEAKRELNITLDAYIFNRPIFANAAYGYRWTRKYYYSLPPLEASNNVKFNPIAKIDSQTGEVIQLYYNAHLITDDSNNTLTPKQIASKVLRSCQANGTILALGHYWKYFKEIDISDIHNALVEKKYNMYNDYLQNRTVRVYHRSSKETP